MTRLAITIEQKGAAALGRRQWSQAIRAGGVDMGKYWHREFRAKRFSETAYSEYGARKRSRPYRKHKLVEKGHNRPLDYSGETRRDSQKQVVNAVIRRSGALEVWVRGPRKLNFRPKSKSGRRQPIDMRSEFRAWSPRERVKLQKVLRQRVLYHLRQLGASQNIVVRLTAA